MILEVRDSLSKLRKECSWLCESRNDDDDGDMKIFLYLFLEGGARTDAGGAEREGEADGEVGGGQAAGDGEKETEPVPIPNYEIQKGEIQPLLTQRLKKEDEWLVHGGGEGGIFV